MSHCFTLVTCFPLLVTSTKLGTLLSLTWSVVGTSISKPLRVSVERLCACVNHNEAVTRIYVVTGIVRRDESMTGRAEGRMRIV